MYDQHRRWNRLEADYKINFHAKWYLRCIMRYIRSDVPENLTDEEVQWLLDNNIITIIDLRSEEEVAQKSCCLTPSPM